ncbi:DUF5659 domain-containing protein [Paenibacillus oryzisoli]|jgi:hypothetical protein|uniref:DUF5659 domain-containing protein n=1 Tax=Paenibacillus oryzisoli TaxID=1850517 RepID=UPI003D269763
MGTYVVMAQKLAGFLMTKGFKLHSLEQNRKDGSKHVFIFTNSIELEKAIEEYKAIRK